MFDKTINPSPVIPETPENSQNLSRSKAGIRARRKRGTGQTEPQLPMPDIIPALLMLAVGTVVAIVITPQEVEPKAALFWPALVMAVSLGLVPLLFSLQQPKRLFEAHHLLVLAPIYWLLLDSLQRIFDLEGVSKSDAVLAFVTIALFAGGVWLGVWGRPWQMPRMVREAATLDITPKALFAISIMAFVFGMGKFAIPCNFNVGVMLQSLLADRWDAPDRKSTRLNSSH